MELSKRLKEVLQMMNDSWELSFTDGLGWQLGGTGKGDALHGKLQINKLINLNFIESVGLSFPTTKYILTAKGNAFVRNLK